MQHQIIRQDPMQKKRNKQATLHVNRGCPVIYSVFFTEEKKEIWKYANTLIPRRKYFLSERNNLEWT